MSAMKGISTKRLLTDKTNNSIVIISGIAAFVTVFSLVATKTLISQAAYQNRVINEKRTTLRQLKTDVTTSAQLKTAYDSFNATPQNIISGNPTGNGEKDGNSAKIILDALPSAYDFPQLATSLEKIITSNNDLKISSITGTDDEVNQATNASSKTPTAIPIPFQVTVDGNYDAIQRLIGQFEHSIRPFQILSISLSGDQSDLTMNLSAQTYYQPAKILNFGQKVVK